MNRLVVISLFCLLTIHVMGQGQDRPEQPDLPGDLLLDVGINLFDQKLDSLPAKPIGSNSLGVFYNKRIALSDHFSFYFGGGFSFEKIAFDSHNTWLSNNNGTIMLDSLSSGIGIKKNKMVIHYFDVPIEFRIHPLGTVNGEGLFIGLGAIGGVRTGAHTKLKYLIGEDTYKQKIYNDFDLNRFRYGVQARLGFRTVHVFYKMYLSDTFNNEPYSGAGNPKIMTFGINFSGF